MTSVCLISGASPEFLGGTSLYKKNLINYSKKNNLELDFTWIYPGEKNREYIRKGIKCIEIRSIKYPILREFDFAKKAKNIISKRSFDIINTHANIRCRTKNNQKIIHTYHGSNYFYIKTQFSRFKFLKFFFYPILLFVYILEKFSFKEADKIICVSEKVRNELQCFYGKKSKTSVIRACVDLKEFKKLNKIKSRKELGLDENKIYGLYSGRGGYWNKGLDRAINLSKEIYKINKNYKLIVIGSDKNKCKKYLDFPFVEYKGLIKRDILPKYYSACDFFFSLSRYEGGAPTLALSEAVASECLVICSKDMDPEILVDGKDCLIIEKFEKKEAEKILKLLKNKKEVKKMNESAKKEIEKLPLEKWGKKYFGELLK